MGRRVRCDATLTITCPRQMRIEMVAIAYHLGKRGMYSLVSKAFIQQGIENYIAGLTPKNKEAYKEVYANVKALADQGAVSGVRSLADYEAWIKPKPRKHKGIPRPE